MVSRYFLKCAIQSSKCLKKHKITFYFQPIEPKRPKSECRDSTLDKLRRRRDSLGLRKISRSRESGLNRISAVNIGLEDHDSAKTKLEFDHRLSLGGKGQIDTQRGLLNKTDLVRNG